MNVISYLESSFWTMRAAEFGSMMRVAYSRAGDLDGMLARTTDFVKPEAMMAKGGERLAGTRYVEMRDGVAVVDVNGIIAKRMDMFDEICFGGTSTEKLLKDIASCVDSPAVHSIVLNIDSPGGEAFGINELSQAIYDARQKKPVKAYVSGLGCSGAYWIASAADEVIVDKSAFLGSIGVVTAWMDDKGFYEQLGIRKEVVTSSNAPLKRLDFDKPEHREELQRELDSIEKVFHKFVAKGRKVTVEQVINDFNQGGVRLGAEAVKAGMADRTGSLEEVIKELRNKKTRTATASAEGDFDMSFKDDFKTFASKIGFNVQEEQNPADEPVAEPAEEPARTPPESAPVEEPKEEPTEPATDQITAMQNRIAQTEASAFIDGEVKAGRLFPSEKETFASLFMQAAMDDFASPLPTGSRVETLKANQAARKPHSLTDEVVDADANQVLLAQAGDGITPERQKELLEKTPLGRAALKLVTSNGKN